MKKLLFPLTVYALFTILLPACGKSNLERSATASGNPGAVDTGKIVQFQNPIWSKGADPWITQSSGTYYYTYTQGSKVVLYKTTDITHLSDVASKTSNAWVPPTGKTYSKNVWAPELHAINGKWYMYFAADDGQNQNHRMYVIENTGSDPTSNSWTFKGKVSDPTDNWAIDGTILDYNNQIYMIWSGWESPSQGNVQNLYIAKLSNPWTVEGSRVMLSTPQYDWEKHSLSVNEGPAVLKNDKGDVFLTYSASLYASDDYCLGMLSLKHGGDPMNKDDWSKSAQPVFKRNDAGYVFGPGHNGFFKSPNGKEDWIVFHARSMAGGGDNNGRNTHIQKFGWNTDGTPNFGIPAPIYQKLDPPAIK